MSPARDEFTDRIVGAINDLMFDVLAAVSRIDYEDRRRGWMRQLFPA
ncbi:hypothetical protein [Aestuariivirga sp.]